MNDQGQSIRVVELYYTAQEVAFLLRFSSKWVRDRINAGDFGENVVDIRGDIRIPASAVNAFLARHPRVYDVDVRAANAGRMRRQMSKQREAGNAV